MIQGDILRVRISDLNSEGEGIARVGDDGFVLFVPGLLTKEEADVRLVVKKKKYGTAKIIERKDTSPERVEPLCHLFTKCGGCQLQHISYAAQLKMKKNAVENALKRIGGIEAPKIFDCVPSPEIWNYRNKAALPVQKTLTEELLIGFYKTRSHEIVKYQNCPILLPEINKIIPEIIKALTSCGFSGVRSNGKNGQNEIIKHIVIRKAQHTGEIIAAIIAQRGLSKKEKSALSLLAEKIEKLKGLVWNINQDNGNFIWGTKTITVYGKQSIEEELCGYKFEFEASSFFQVNTEQTENLYKYAAEKALEGKPSKILELYSGTGTLTAFLASGAAEVTAVESWKPAEKYILINARHNSLTNIKSCCAQAEDIAEELTHNKYDAVVLDPPRTGCNEKVISALIKISAPKIIYVSCNPATLARDIKRFTEAGYRCISAQPFDMFPQTGHVETVVLLSKYS